MRMMTGVKPTSNFLHLGNYFSSINPIIINQDESDDVYIFIADLHALTTLNNKIEISNNIHELIIQYLSLGVDPESCHIYRQSKFPEICELSWILSCVVPMGTLLRSHAYKAAEFEADNKRKELQNRGKFNEAANVGVTINVGTFCYPVLMAADILSISADSVPVGEDQLQHIQIARELATRFNSKYGNVLKIPDPKIILGAEKIPGTDGQKMSKSYNNYLGIFETEKSLMTKIKQIKTDGTPKGQSLKPSNCTIFSLHRLFSNSSEINDLEKLYFNGEIGYMESKQLLFEKFLFLFKEQRERYLELSKYSDSDLDDLIFKSELGVGAEISVLMKKVKDSVGI